MRGGNSEAPHSSPSVVVSSGSIAMGGGAPAEVVSISSSSSSSGMMEEAYVAPPPPQLMMSAEEDTTTQPIVCPPPPVSALESTPIPADLAQWEVFTRLDPSQQRAVAFDIHAPLLLQAGAGSGKTQTMATRIAYLLLRGVPARSILGLCFTRQAAETLRLRVRSVLPHPELAQGLHLHTMHAFGLSCLRRFGRIPPDTEVYDAGKQRQLAKRVVEQHAVHFKTLDAVDDLIDYVNRIKAKKNPPNIQVDPTQQASYLFRFYQTELHDRHHAVDFGDLQHLFHDLLRPVPSAEVAEVGGGAPAERRPSLVCSCLRGELTHIIVDEFQDFNEIQVEILALLAGDVCRVTCVGDPNQCIYVWRGAMSSVFPTWQRRFPQATLLRLGMNYRSDEPIVRAANRLVQTEQAAFHHRHQRKLTLVQCELDVDVEDAIPRVIEHIIRRRDATMVYGSIAVLCRTRKRVKSCLELLRSRHIPVRELSGVAVDGMRVGRALMSYLSLCLNPSEDDAVRSILCDAPNHLAPRTTKEFFCSLSSTCLERRQQQQQQQSHPTSSSSSCPSTSNNQYSSFYGVVSDLVHHNFNADVFPKIRLTKPAQKVLRSMVQIISEGQEMLARSRNGADCLPVVEQLLRLIARAGGFETDTSASVVSRKRGRTSTGQAASSAAAAASHCADIADSVAAEFSSRRAASPPTEEGDTELSITALLMRAFDGVREAILSEVHRRRPRDDDDVERGEDVQEGSNSAPIQPVVEVPIDARGVLRRVLDEFLTLAPSDDFGGEDLSENGERCGRLGEVVVGTVHRAKGMEWPAVILPGCWVGEFPIKMSNDEERRIFYVAMSRAMTDLVCLTARRRCSSLDMMGESKVPGATEDAPQGMLQRTPYLDVVLHDEMETILYRDLQHEHLRQHNQL